MGLRTKGRVWKRKKGNGKMAKKVFGIAVMAVFALLIVVFIASAIAAPENNAKSYLEGCQWQPVIVVDGGGLIQTMRANKAMPDVSYWSALEHEISEYNRVHGVDIDHLKKHQVLYIPIPDPNKK